MPHTQWMETLTCEKSFRIGLTGGVGRDLCVSPLQQAG